MAPSNFHKYPWALKEGYRDRFFIVRPNTILTDRELKAITSNRVNRGWFGDIGSPQRTTDPLEYRRLWNKNRYLKDLLERGVIVPVPHYYIPAREPALTKLYENGRVNQPHYKGDIDIYGQFLLWDNIIPVLNQCLRLSQQFPSNAITGDIVRDLDSIAWRLGSAWEEIRPLSCLRENDMAEADRRLNHQAWMEGTETVYIIGSEALAMREKLTSTLAEDTHSPEGVRREALTATLDRMKELRAPDPDAISGELLDTYKKALTAS